MTGEGSLVTSTPAKTQADSEIPGSLSWSRAAGRCSKCKWIWSFLGPTLEIKEYFWIYPLPSKISLTMALETTSLEAKSFAVGAYLSINLSPSEFLRIPPSPLQPSVIKHPDP